MEIALAHRQVIFCCRGATIDMSPSGCDERRVLVALLAEWLPNVSSLHPSTWSSIADWRSASSMAIGLIRTVRSFACLALAHEAGTTSAYPVTQRDQTAHILPAHASPSRCSLRAARRTRETACRSVCPKLADSL